MARQQSKSAIGTARSKTDRVQHAVSGECKEMRAVEDGDEEEVIGSWRRVVERADQREAVDSAHAAAKGERRVAADGAARQVHRPAGLSVEIYSAPFVQSGVGFYANTVESH